MKKIIPIVLASSVLAAFSLQSLAQSTALPADNTKSNSTAGTTADAQRNDATDLDLSKRIRQSIMADKSLSTYAHNIKVVAVNGTVTLNGVVRSEGEKKAIETKATSVAGQSNVVDQLNVAPPK
jgi:hyperosmotically inducible periplasmic protein